MDQRSKKTNDNECVLHLREDITRQYLSRKAGGRKLAKIMSMDRYDDSLKKRRFEFIFDIKKITLSLN